MPLNNTKIVEEKDNVSKELINDIALTFDSISIDNVMEYYDNNDLTSLQEYVQNLKLFNFLNILNDLREQKNIAPLKSLEDISMDDVIKKYKELRIAINTVLKIKSHFNDLKVRWEELHSIVNAMYDAQRVTALLKPEVKEMSSKELREAKVKEICQPLLKVLTKIEIMVGRFVQVEKEILETLKCLDDNKSDTSRIQSGIALALDTGEIPATYWRKK